jgi:predicted  nucleic acid-binding Zn ribbon protein
MYTAELGFKIVRRTDDEAISWRMNAFLWALKHNGQILSDDWPKVVRAGLALAIVSLPEPDALRARRRSPNVIAARRDLGKAGLGPPRAKILGREIDSLDVCQHKVSSSYILTTNALCGESPLRCGDCFDPVPLYRIPPTSEFHNYEDIIWWRHHYRHFDWMWIDSSTGELFAYRQMSRADSELSRQGRDLCRKIRKLTGQRAYYYLHRYYGRNLAAERRRLCPGCNRKWLLGEKWHKRFDFRCDRCCLLSNIADNLG